MAGFVYVLTHEAMPGVVKIGRTNQDPQRRLAQINSFLGQHPDLPGFVMAFWSPCRGPCERAEATLHHRFWRERIGLRELFAVDLETVRRAMEEVTKRAAVAERTEAWPFQRPPRQRGGRIVRGGRVYGWLYEHRGEMAARMAAPGFSWPALAYEIGLAVAEEGEKFCPLPPDLVRHLWRCVCGVCARDGIPMAGEAEGEAIHAPA